MAAPALPLARLNDTNYQMWAVKMEMFLRKENLWNITEALPLDPSAAEKRDDEKALANIILCLEDSQLIHVRGVESAHECWTILRRLYVRSSVLSKISLARKLYRTRMQPGTSVAKHLQVMQGMFIELEEKGETFPELHKVFIILSSLPDYFDTLVTSLESLPQGELTLAYLSGRLLEEELKQMDNKEAREKVSSLSKVPGCTNFSNQGMTSSSIHVVKKCYLCGSASHLQRCCPSRGARTARAWARGRRRGMQRDFVSVLQTTDKTTNHQWLIDSGASNHVAYSQALFTSLRPTSLISVTLATGTSAPVEGIGTVYLSELGEFVEDVLYVPQLSYNLLSVSALTQHGFKVTFDNGTCMLHKGQALVASGLLQGGLYVLTTPTSVGTAQAVFNNKPKHNNCIHLLHRRLGHASFSVLKKTVENSYGLKLNKCSEFLDCAVCKKEKSKASPVSKCSERVTSRPFELCYADLIGPYQESYGGARYVLVLIDHHTRYTFVYVLKSKDQTASSIIEWVNYVERRYGHLVGQLQTDRGTEFTNKQLEDWLRARGIRHRLCNVATPAENGMVEKKNDVLQQIMRCLLNDSGLSKHYWAESMFTACYLTNRIYQSHLRCTPFEALYGRKPNLSHLRLFGSMAWVNIPKKFRRKSQDRARKMIFLGYEPATKSYRFADKDRKIICSRSASFSEQYGWDRIKESFVYLPMESKEEAEKSLVKEEKIDTEKECVSQKSDVIQTESQDVELRRSKRENKGIPPQRYSPDGITLCNVLTEPQSYADVMKLPNEEKLKWQQAMQKEYRALCDKQVFESVDLPVGIKPIGCRWVYKMKHLVDGSVEYKARIVAKGYAQANTSFDETFSPTVKSQSIRLCLVQAAINNSLVYHLDINTAFLNANLNHTVYMQAAPGFEGEPGKVWLLHKALYGLRQSAYEWHSCLADTLKNLGFVPAKADPCVYVKKSIVLLCHVDDLLLIADTKSVISQAITELSTVFALKNLGEVKSYLGVSIVKTVGNGYLWHQQDKIVQLLKAYRMEDCKGARTPMSENFQKELSEDEKPCDKALYQAAVGSLNYLAQWSRPDIACAVNILSRHVAEPSQAHWVGVKRILRYLKNTMNYCMCLKPTDLYELTAYVDSDWGSDMCTRKSTSGMVIYFAGVPVGWKVAQQSLVSLSSTEAEYAALSDLCTEIEWYHQLLVDLKLPHEQPVTVYEDSQSCITMATSKNIKARTKHVGLRYGNVKNAVERKLIELRYCPTEYMIADGLTKALGVNKHSQMISKLGITSQV